MNSCKFFNLNEKSQEISTTTPRFKNELSSNKSKRIQNHKRTSSFINIRNFQSLKETFESGVINPNKNMVNIKDDRKVDQFVYKHKNMGSFKIIQPDINLNYSNDNSQSKITNNEDIGETVTFNNKDLLLCSITSNDDIEDDLKMSEVFDLYKDLSDYQKISKTITNQSKRKIVHKSKNSSNIINSKNIRLNANNEQSNFLTNIILKDSIQNTENSINEAYSKKIIPKKLPKMKTKNQSRNIIINNNINNTLNESPSTNQSLNPLKTFQTYNNIYFKKTPKHESQNIFFPNFKEKYPEFRRINKINKKYNKINIHKNNILNTEVPYRTHQIKSRNVEEFQKGSLTASNIFINNLSTYNKLEVSNEAILSFSKI